VLNDEACALLAGVLECEEVLAPKTTLLSFDRAFEKPGGAAQVFNAMGKTVAFKKVHELIITQPKLTTEAFHALSSTLKTDALPSLTTITLKYISIKSDDLASLLESLAQSACAQQLKILGFYDCDLCAECAKVLGLAIE